MPNGSAITIRHLLNHTSGLFDYTNDEAAVEAEIANPSRVWTPRELLSVAFSHPPLFAPGADWSYSNTNYVVLGLVVEAVTGKKLEQVLAERLFEPLGLHATSFPRGLSVPEPFAHGTRSSRARCSISHRWSIRRGPTRRATWCPMPPTSRRSSPRCSEVD